MADGAKTLAVILVIAALVFRFARPVALQFSSEPDFRRRRNLWMTLTTIAFLSPNFWVFALFAIPLYLWVGRKDSNPVALYLLLMQVIPSIPVDIPIPGLNAFFALDNYRLLAFCVLIPVARRIKKAKQGSGATAMDAFLLALGALQIWLFIPPDTHGHFIFQDSITNMIRRTFLFFVDTYVLYYVVSRSCSSRRAFLEALSAFWLAGTIMAAIAIVESLRHWPLYATVVTRWSFALPWQFYELRNGILRAQASAGDKLALGYMLAISYAFWLTMQTYVEAKVTRIAVVILLWGGLFASYARGEWIGAVIAFLTFSALGPRATSKLLKSSIFAILITAVVSVSPLGNKIVSVLPFVGSSEQNNASDTVTYRQQLLARSYDIIIANPFFGDQLAFFKMEDLRQGEGIIDLVNSYVEMALFYGLTGLALFVGLMLIAIINTYKAVRDFSRSDSELAKLGVGVIAAIVSTLFMVGTLSLMLVAEKMYYVLAGLAAAYIQMSRGTPRVPNLAGGSSSNSQT